jgi:hypothetical protein
LFIFQILYENSKVGKNTVADMMPKFSNAIGVQHLTNNQIRPTGIRLLKRAGHDDRSIMTVTGHKCMETLKFYDPEPTFQNKAAMASAISSLGKALPQKAVRPLEEVQPQAVRPLEEVQPQAVRPQEQVQPQEVRPHEEVQPQAVRPLEEVQPQAVRPLEEVQPQAVRPLEEVQPQVVQPVEEVQAEVVQVQAEAMEEDNNVLVAFEAPVQQFAQVHQPNIGQLVQNVFQPMINTLNVGLQDQCPAKRQRLHSDTIRMAHNHNLMAQQLFMGDMMKTMANVMGGAQAIMTKQENALNAREDKEN